MEKVLKMKLALSKFIHKMKLFGYKNDKLCSYLVLLLATLSVGLFPSHDQIASLPPRGCHFKGLIKHNHITQSINKTDNVNQR